MTMKFFAAGLSFLVLGAILGDSAAVAQSSEEDIARIEEKAATQKLAREIFERADKRVKEAFENSPKLQAEYQKKVLECIEVRKNPILTSSSEQCQRDVKGYHYRQYAGIISDLRGEFIAEEIEALGLDKQERKVLDEEIGKLSI